MICARDTHYKIEYEVKFYLASTCHSRYSSVFVVFFKATEEKHFPLEPMSCSLLSTK